MARFIGTPRDERIFTTEVSPYVTVTPVGTGPSAANDYIWAGAGNDTIVSAGGYDTINAGDGDDLVYLGVDGGIIYAGAGDDRLVWYGQTPSGDFHVRAGAGGDSITAGSGTDWIRGEAGNDTIKGGAGNDTLEGGAGNDVIFGDAGVDILLGGAGDDSLLSGPGKMPDYIDAGTGNDIVFVAGGVGETVLGGKGQDTLAFRNFEPDSIYTPDIIFNMTKGKANIKDALYLGFEVVGTGAGNDQVEGTTADDFIYTLAGDDLVYGRKGNDTIIGGLGDDTLFGHRGADDMLVDGAGSVAYGGFGADLITVRNGATAYGGGGDDSLRGSGVMHGGAGDDTISGYDPRGGNYPADDTLDGGAGQNLLTGHLGDDNFVFRGNPTARAQTTITDFNGSDGSEQDALVFSGQVRRFDDSLIQNGRDADTNADGRIDEDDDGWSLDPVNGLTFEGKYGSLMLNGISVLDVGDIL